MPFKIGLTPQGTLQPCAESSNCVCSQGTSDPNHAIEPLHLESDPARAKADLTNVLAQLPRTRIVEQQENYWHVEFRSRIFGFVDDVEFLFDPANALIHVRSASRVGTYDWGVNRRRVETIRRMFASRAARAFAAAA